MKMENWIEAINVEIQEMKKHNKLLEKRIDQNEILIKETQMRTEFLILQQLRSWWKKLLGIQEKFELKR